MFYQLQKFIFIQRDYKKEYDYDFLWINKIFLFYSYKAVWTTSYYFLWFCTFISQFKPEESCSQISFFATAAFSFSCRKPEIYVWNCAFFILRYYVVKLLYTDRKAEFHRTGPLTVRSKWAVCSPRCKISLTPLPLGFPWLPQRTVTTQSYNIPFLFFSLVTTVIDMVGWELGSAPPSGSRLTCSERKLHLRVFLEEESRFSTSFFLSVGATQ